MKCYFQLSLIGWQKADIKYMADDRTSDWLFVARSYPGLCLWILIKSFIMAICGSQL